MADDAILAFCEDFRQRHGVRPTAVELYHSGYNPRSLRRTHGSWMKFLKAMGDLTDGERTQVTLSDLVGPSRRYLKVRRQMAAGLVRPFPVVRQSIFCNAVDFPG